MRKYEERVVCISETKNHNCKEMEIINLSRGKKPLRQDGVDKKDCRDRCERCGLQVKTTWHNHRTIQCSLHTVPGDTKVHVNPGISRKRHSRSLQLVRQRDVTLIIHIWLDKFTPFSRNKHTNFNMREKSLKNLKTGIRKILGLPVNATINGKAATLFFFRNFSKVESSWCHESRFFLL